MRVSNAFAYQGLRMRISRKSSQKLEAVAKQDAFRGPAPTAEG